MTVLIDNLDDLLDLGPRLDLLYPAGELENGVIHDSDAGHVVAPSFQLCRFLTQKKDTSRKEMADHDIVKTVHCN